MKVNVKLVLAAIFVVLGLHSIGFAQKTVSVKFAKGKSSANVNGVIRGYEYNDFVFSAQGGQKLKVSLTTKTYSTVFDIFKQKGNFSNSDNDAGETVNVDIPADGNYVVRVRIMRSQARRKNSTANFNLKIAIQ